MGTSLVYKLASTAEEFEAIHRLNYISFVEEIPQHAANPQSRLVDQFHDENTYAICLDDSQLVGMIAGRCQRPFSLDKKIDDLDAQLPAHTKVVEVRLLAVAAAHRKPTVFSRLAGLLARYFRSDGCDLAIISGTVRQLALYRHLGFEPKRLFRAYGADLCLDAVSAIGLRDVDLRGVRFASAVSGKSLGSYCELAMVFHDGVLEAADNVPRYLDLSAYEDCMGVPFMQSSNLLAALDSALNLADWPARWCAIQSADAALSAELGEEGFQIIGAPVRTAGIVTLAIPGEVRSSALLKAMAHRGYLLAGRSAYLQQRNWVQICLMGQLRNELLEIPPRKAARVQRCGAAVAGLRSAPRGPSRTGRPGSGADAGLAPVPHPPHPARPAATVPASRRGGSWRRAHRNGRGLGRPGAAVPIRQRCQHDE
jgi:hypothetical protein